jgi:hypothetical protein
MKDLLTWFVIVAVAFLLLRVLGLQITVLFLLVAVGWLIVFVIRLSKEE